MDFLLDHLNTTCPLCGGKGKLLVPQEGHFIETTCTCKATAMFDPKAKEKRALTAEWFASHIQNEAYRVLFVAETLRGGVDPSQLGKTDFETYVRQLATILNNVSQGRKPLHSYFITAPKGYGKKYFIFNLMMEAYKSGFNPSPLLNLRSIVDARVSFNHAYIDEVLSYDMLLVTLGSEVNRASVRALQFLLDEAEMRGVPIILVTKTPLRSIHSLEPHFDYKIQREITRLGAYSEMVHIEVQSPPRKRGV